MGSWFGGHSLLGMVAAGIGVALRPRIFSYVVAAWLLGIAALRAGQGRKLYYDAEAMAFTGAVAETLRRGRIRLSSPLLFAISALLMLLAGAAAEDDAHAQFLHGRYLSSRLRWGRRD